ncbi:hypothetical protein EYF80_003535 [Liparis tanakae]|uniref:Uncharacterized protein n=1 Tax=Liparis tanakae TaxID=230148 RepID=A0A4Z2J8U4_9TELE|nr:hypothetical protein EYF80_003535 [Liparis tanakae]
MDPAWVSPGGGGASGSWGSWGPRGASSLSGRRPTIVSTVLDVSLSGSDVHPPPAMKRLPPTQPVEMSIIALHRGRMSKDEPLAPATPASHAPPIARWWRTTREEA